MRDNALLATVATMLLITVCAGSCVQGVVYMGELTKLQNKTYHNYYRDEYGYHYANEENYTEYPSDTIQEADTASSRDDNYYY